MKNINVIILVNVLLLLAAKPCLAGWLFGPGKADASKVSLVFSEKEGCAKGLYPFRVTNNSEYTVNKITFKASGKYDGRSTEYNLNNNSWSSTSDIVLKPSESRILCSRLNLDAVPETDSILRIVAKVVEIEFKYKNGAEIVSLNPSSVY